MGSIYLCRYITVYINRGSAHLLFPALPQQWRHRWWWIEPGAMNRGDVILWSTKGWADWPEGEVDAGGWIGGCSQKPPSPVYLISHHNCLSTPLECSVFMVTPAIQPASYPAPSVVVVVVLHPVSTTLPHPMPMQVPSVLPMYACLPACLPSSWLWHIRRPVER